MSKHASPAVIGGFVVAAVALVIAGILVLGGGRYFRDTAHVIVYFDGSIGGLQIGGPVKFRGIQVGTVKDLRISMTGAISDPQHIRIPVLLELDEDRLSEQGVGHVDFNDPEEVARLVGLGLRAELETESFVTGVRYVALDVRPGTPARLVHDPKYPEVPSLPGLTSEISGKVDRILGNLAEVDTKQLAESMRSTIDLANRLLGSPHIERALTRLDNLTANVDQALRELNPTIRAVKDTATSARDAVAPAGLLATRLDLALRDVQAAARSLRRLTDQLNRDPGSLVRGGTP